jgi:hypothetical protein
MLGSAVKYPSREKGRGEGVATKQFLHAEVTCHAEVTLLQNVISQGYDGIASGS